MFSIFNYGDDSIFRFYLRNGPLSKTDQFIDRSPSRPRHDVARVEMKIIRQIKGIKKLGLSNLRIAIPQF